MRRLHPRIMILVMILLASSCAVGFADGHITEPRDFGVLSCGVSGVVLPTISGCFFKRRILTLGDLEVSLGLDGRLAFTEDRHGYLGAYIVFDYFAPSWSAFLEILTPSVFAPIGSSDLWRFGFTIQL